MKFSQLLHLWLRLCWKLSFLVKTQVSLHCQGTAFDDAGSSWEHINCDVLLRAHDDPRVDYTLAWGPFENNWFNASLDTLSICCRFYGNKYGGLLMSVFCELYIDDDDDCDTLSDDSRLYQPKLLPD